MLTLLAALNAAHAQEDPRLWLEEVEGEQALSWVRERNAQTVDAYASEPAFQSMQQRIEAALNSDDKIAYVSERGGFLYNFWQDSEHEQGLWRRTTWDSYRSGEPEWDVVLDLDALSEADGERWVWHGAECLRPDYTRCLISLSPGGSDADVVREFDIDARAFVDGGFELPEAKSTIHWIDIDTVYVGTPVDDNSMTDSGYPRTIRRWRRGTELASAPIVFEGQQTDVSAGAYFDDTPGYERHFAYRSPSFFENEVFLLRGGEAIRIEKPDTTDADVVRRHIYFEPKEDWTLNGTTYRAGTLLVADFKRWMKGKRDVQVLFEPTESTSLRYWTATQDYIILGLLEDVRSTFVQITPEKSARKPWTRAAMTGLPELGTVSLSPVNADTSNGLWVTYSDFLTPSSYGLIEPGGALENLRSSPSRFDAPDHQVTQHFATSEDGTRVPYFQIAPTDIPQGGLPTLLYGYGGFEISLLPSYSAGRGIGWYEQGGVLVVANIRGGGEYGPSWHRAALRDQRHKAYEDFAAIARDLVARGVTTHEQLATRGGSNGGLLMGNMLTTYPELFGAIHCAVPLLDMKRFNKLLAGASWMGEYGNPDEPEDWAFLEQYSPYHNVDAQAEYPPILFTTSTKDDRVHPGHARKMAHLLGETGAPMTYYENIEGGHGGAANNEQRAFMSTLAYRYLWRQVTGTAPVERVDEQPDDEPLQASP